MVYFIESGQIKLLMLSSEGKECLLAIHSGGDIFGELCLSRLGPRLETATAMKVTMLKQIPCDQFFARLRRDSLFEGFVAVPGRAHCGPAAGDRQSSDGG
jgi:CRP/FNR family transcriptional regulator, cyclic AMP receptor protein